MLGNLKLRLALCCPGWLCLLGAPILYPSTGIFSILALEDKEANLPPQHLTDFNVKC